ncbi:MAG TPA: DUF2177 family protein [Gammaproteobacteria bacterium]|nr:DUF2177 family protein [Gammaproteobacteria bacterium]
MGDLLRSGALNYGVIALVYVLLVWGLARLVLAQSLSRQEALKLGCLYGVIVYGVYSLTCCVLIQGWPLSLALMDTVWGGFLCSVTAMVGYSIKRP